MRRLVAAALAAVCIPVLAQQQLKPKCQEVSRIVSKQVNDYCKEPSGTRKEYDRCLVAGVQVVMRAIGKCEAGEDWRE